MGDHAKGNDPRWQPGEHAPALRQRIGFCTSYDGTRIAYARHGHGPPLVKVAHWPTHLQEDWRSPIWRPRLTDIGERFTLTRYDCRDTGMSDRNVRTVTLDAWVADLESVVDATGLDQFSLLGIGQGGPIAIAYAYRHPERVAGLVLYGTFAVGRARRVNAAPGETGALATLMRLSWNDQNAATRQMWTTRLIPDGTMDQMRWLNEMQRRSASADAAERSYIVSTELDVSSEAQRLTSPTMVMHARGDSFVPFESGRELAALIPGATFVPLASNNHLTLADESAWSDLLHEMGVFLGAPRMAKASLSVLSAREQELAAFIAAGLDNSSIAHRMSISPLTVRNHITHIFAKLEIQTRAQLIVRVHGSDIDPANR